MKIGVGLEMGREGGMVVLRAGKYDVRCFWMEGLISYRVSWAREMEGRRGVAESLEMISKMSFLIVWYGLEAMMDRSIDMKR